MKSCSTTLLTDSSCVMEMFPVLVRGRSGRDAELEVEVEGRTAERYKKPVPVQSNLESALNSQT